MDATGEGASSDVASVFFGALIRCLALPPPNLAIIALVGPRRVARIAAAGLVVLGMPVVGSLALQSLEWDMQRPDPLSAGAQAIVVLGGDVSDGVAEPGVGDAGAGGLTAQRLIWGASLAKSTRLPVLVTGGTVLNGVPPVGAVMADTLRNVFGAAPRWAEIRSVDTWQNAVLSAAMLRPAGISRVLLVSHAWHLRRAMIAFRAAGLQPVAAPGQWDRLGAIEASGFLPQPGGWLKSYYAAHEWLGCAVYWLRSRIERRRHAGTM